MKHRIALVSILGLAALTLTGCSSSGHANQTVPTPPSTAHTTSASAKATPARRPGQFMVATDRLGGAIYRASTEPVGGATAAVRTE